MPKPLHPTIHWHQLALSELNRKPTMPPSIWPFCLWFSSIASCRSRWASGDPFEMTSTSRAFTKLELIRLARIWGKYLLRWQMDCDCRFAWLILCRQFVLCRSQREWTVTSSTLRQSDREKKRKARFRPLSSSEEFYISQEPLYSEEDLLEAKVESDVVSG